MQQPPGLLLDHKHNTRGCFQSLLCMTEKMKRSKWETDFGAGKNNTHREVKQGVKGRQTRLQDYESFQEIFHTALTWKLIRTFNHLVMLWSKTRQHLSITAPCFFFFTTSDWLSVSLSASPNSNFPTDPFRSLCLLYVNNTQLWVITHNSQCDFTHYS